MTNRKCALLIFSKPPVPGLVKTRLTRERGGILTPEQAAEFFRRSLYDVSELSMHALIELQRENDAAVAADPTAEAVTYDFYVSTTPADNVELMRETYEAIGRGHGGALPDRCGRHLRRPLRRRLLAAVRLGLRCGGVGGRRPFPRCRRATSPRPSSGSTTSAPSARPVSCRRPCQECGTSLVGWCAETPMDNQGVYYNTGGKAALDAYVEKLKATGRPPRRTCRRWPMWTRGAIWPTPSRACAPSRRRPRHQGLFVPRRVLNWIDFLGLKVTTPPNENHDPRQYIDK